jgi:hypothetical protein
MTGRDLDNVRIVDWKKWSVQSALAHTSSDNLMGQTGAGFQREGSVDAQFSHFTFYELDELIDIFYLISPRYEAWQLQNPGLVSIAGLSEKGAPLPSPP